MLGSQHDQATTLQKSALRTQLKAARKLVDSQLQQEAAGFAARAIAQLPEWSSARCLASYLPINGEFDPSPIDKAARRRDMTVVYPRIVAPGILEFSQWSPGETLDTVQHGLHQPSQMATAQRPSDIDIVLVPLVGWDARGGRLGYGGGYYDRVLTAMNALTIGLGFECQQVMAVPRERHDQLLKVVVSEKQLYRFSSSNTVNA